MKNSLFQVSFLLLISANICKAQQDSNFNKPLVHADKQSYNVSKSIINSKKFVINSNNHLNKAQYNHVVTTSDKGHGFEIPPKASDVQYNKALIVKIVYDSFTNARLKKLADEDLDLQINYFVDNHGNIMNLSFVFSDVSSLKPIEIEKLEDLLQKEVKFTLNDKVFKNYAFIPLHNYVNFKKLVNHEQNAVFP